MGSMTSNGHTHPISPVIAAALARSPSNAKCKKAKNSTNNFIAVGPDSGNRKGAGARPGNRHALRHGLRSAEHRARRAEV